MTSPIHGPYFIDEARAAICSRCPRTGEVLTLCMFTEWGPRDRATARAMVASLDMLAALKEVVRLSDRKHEAWDRARAVIAKADGRYTSSLDAMRTGSRRYRRALSGLAKS